MIQFSFDVSVIVLLGLHQPIRSSASGAALANQKLSCWVPLLLEQLWPIRSSASGAALANQKLSCWVPLGTVTGFHTKPPIMPIFSGFRSVQFIIQRSSSIIWRRVNESGRGLSLTPLQAKLFFTRVLPNHKWKKPPVSQWGVECKPLTWKTPSLTYSLTLEARHSC